MRRKAGKQGWNESIHDISVFIRTYIVDSHSAPTISWSDQMELIEQIFIRFNRSDFCFQTRLYSKSITCYDVWTMYMPSCGEPHHACSRSSSHAQMLGLRQLVRMKHPFIEHGLRDHSDGGRTRTFKQSLPVGQLIIFCLRLCNQVCLVNQNTLIIRALSSRTCSLAAPSRDVEWMKRKN